jgi:hypothetical protein
MGYVRTTVGGKPPHTVVLRGLPSKDRGRVHSIIQRVVGLKFLLRPVVAGTFYTIKLVPDDPAAPRPTHTDLAIAVDSYTTGRD